MHSSEQRKHLEEELWGEHESHASLSVYSFHTSCGIWDNWTNQILCMHFPIFYRVCGLLNMWETQIFCAFWLFMTLFPFISTVNWNCIVVQKCLCIIICVYSHIFIVSSLSGFDPKRYTVVCSAALNFKCLNVFMGCLMCRGREWKNSYELLNKKYYGKTCV
jgi:hypothetical protein